MARSSVRLRAEAMFTRPGGAVPIRDIVVMGASAGGVKTLQDVVRRLPPELPAAIFVVLHIPPHTASYLADILNRAGALPAHAAIDGENIDPGHIYVAPPDRHLLVRRGTIELSAAPKENGMRPAVDPLFRSAARSYRSRVVGVVLSGTLADGTAGLGVIKQLGGLAIVQDPREALHAGMPSNAMQQVDVDYVLSAEQIGVKLGELALHPDPGSRLQKGGTLVADDSRDLDLPDLSRSVDESADIGMPSGIACPSCGGALWETDEAGVKQFRCYLGHNFALANLLASQWDALEGALWNGVRTMRERAALLRRAADITVPSQLNMVSQRYRKQADEFEEQATAIVRLLEQAGHAERSA
jgi:two-component system, chemotaxis family, protein-glutamate methylesterase/glutaminase